MSDTEELLKRHGYEFGNIIGIECSICGDAFRGNDRAICCLSCAQDEMIEALTEEKERLQGYISDWRHECAQKDVSIKRLTAENKKLRRMLKNVHLEHDIPCDCVGDDDCPVCEDWQAALSPQPEGQDDD